MNDDEWEKQRQRSIMAAFQTGRPVFGDSEGVLKFADNDEPVGDDVGWTGEGVPPAKTVKPSWWTQLKARLRR